MTPQKIPRNSTDGLCVSSDKRLRWCIMKNFSSFDFPINSADCAEIEAIFIELMRQRETAAQLEAGATAPTSNPPLSAQDF